MTDILKGFNKVADTTPGKDKPLTEITPSKKPINDNAAMKKLLEGLDSQQKSVNQMPGTHVMAKHGAKHPASNFLVGGEFDEDGQELAEAEATPTVGAQVVIHSQKGKIRGTIDKVSGNGQMFSIDSESQFNIAKKNPMGGWRLKDDINHSKVTISESTVTEGFESARAVAIELKSMYDNEPGIQKAAQSSPEFYRALIYITYPGAETIDGTDYWYDIVTELENLFTSNDTALEEAKSDENFTADDLQELNGIRDLEELKQRAIALISNPDSARPMKPEKVEWFTRNISEKTSNAAIIKLMWDLLLAGEGASVIGSGSSMKKSSYRKKFGEEKLSGKQTFKDIFKSMSETDDEKVLNLERELHASMKADKTLKRNDAGKFDLNEKEINEGQLEDNLDDLVAQVKNLSYFAENSQSVADEFKTNNGETFIILANRIIKLARKIQKSG